MMGSSVTLGGTMAVLVVFLRYKQRNKQLTKATIVKRGFLNAKNKMPNIQYPIEIWDEKRAHHLKTVKLGVYMQNTTPKTNIIEII